MNNETIIGSVNKGNEAFFIADYLKKNMNAHFYI